MSLRKTLLPQPGYDQTRESSARSNRPIIIVGAGWSGLSCGVELVRRGHRVHLIEAGRELGGRARSIDTTLGGERVRLDNGQHLAIGAYRSLLRLQRTLGLQESSLFRRLPLRLHVRSPAGLELDLAAPRYPAPLHLLAALLSARGLSSRDKVRALPGMLHLMHRPSAAELSVSDLLHRLHQPARLIKLLWEPLCIGALNTPMAEASASLFQRVLQESFTGARENSDFLIPRLGLSELLPEAAAQFIHSHGNPLTRGRVTELCFDGDRVCGVRLREGHQIDGAEVLLAVAPEAAIQLLQPRRPQLAAQIGRLGGEPICTLFLRLARPWSGPHPIISLNGGPAEWIFFEAMGRRDLASVVISAARSYQGGAKAELIGQILRQLRATFPHMPQPRDTRLICERRATFSASIGSERDRPEIGSPLPGLWLTGDYCATDLPATLEGAVRAGVELAARVSAARASVEDRKHPPLASTYRQSSN